MADSVGPDVMGGEVDGIEQSIRWLVERLPAHGDYLARYCPAPA
jgi:tryptophan halogenase